MFHFLPARVIVLHAVVCRRLSASSVVYNTAGVRADRPQGVWAVRRPTLHGGPVRLRPVRATPCFIYVTICRIPTRKTVKKHPCFNNVITSPRVGVRSIATSVSVCLFIGLCHRESRMPDSMSGCVWNVSDVMNSFIVLTNVGHECASWEERSVVVSSVAVDALPSWVVPPVDCSREHVPADNQSEEPSSLDTCVTQQTSIVICYSMNKLTCYIYLLMQSRIIRIDARKYFFSNGVIQSWNSLPATSEDWKSSPVMWQVKTFVRNQLTSDGTTTIIMDTTLALQWSRTIG